MGWSVLISNILLPLMNSKLEVSPRACAFISLKKWKLKIVQALCHENHQLLVREWLEKLNESLTNLSMFADQPNFPDTRTQGDELKRLEIWTLATLSPSCCFIQSHSRLYSCLFSLSVTSSSSPDLIIFLRTIFKSKFPGNKIVFEQSKAR